MHRSNKKILELCEEIENEAREMFASADLPDTLGLDKVCLERGASVRENLAQLLRSSGLADEGQSSFNKRRILLICAAYEKEAIHMLIEADFHSKSFIDKSLLERSGIDLVKLLRRLRSANQSQLGFKFMLDILLQNFKCPRTGRF